MASITRDQLGLRISWDSLTRTVHNRATDKENGLEITGDWIVVLIDNSEDGTIIIYCEPPTREEVKA